MPIGAAIGGAAIIGGGASIISGNKAANATEHAAETADATNRYIYDTTRADYAPYRDVGREALYKLADMYGVSRPTTVAGQVGAGGTGTSTAMTPGYGGFQESPGYRFRVDEATKAIERSAAARGGLRTGATMDAIQRRVQGVASDEYENFANRLAALAGVGQTGTAGSAAAGANYAANSQANAINAGNARASAYANTGNAINNTTQNLTAAYLYTQGFGGGGGGAPTNLLAGTPYG